MREEWKRAFLACVIVTVFGSLAAAEEAAATVDVANQNNFNTNSPGQGACFGWRFGALEDVSITHLGLLDLGDEDLLNDYEMGIWRLPPEGGAEFLQGSRVSIASGTTPDSDSHVYTALEEPIILTAGERYLVGAYTPVEVWDALIILSPLDNTAYTITAAVEGIIHFETCLSRDGLDEFDYPWGATSSYVGVNFKYDLVTNQPPVAAPDSGETEAGVPVTIVVLDNDLDDDGDLLVVDSVTQAANGSVTLNSDSTVTYTPDLTFTGIDAFLYTISDGNGGTSEAEVTVAVDPKIVLIDIKPCSYPNSINLGSNGVVPVAILSSVDFDATTVDPQKVSLAGAGVAVRGKGNKYLASEEDIDGDGLVDLSLKVETENLDEDEFQNGYAVLTAETYDGQPITGSDEINIVPQQ